MAQAEQRRLADSALLAEWRRQLHAASASADGTAASSVPSGPRQPPPPLDQKPLVKVLRSIASRFESTDSSTTSVDIEDLSVFLTSRSFFAVLLQSLHLKQAQSTAPVFVILERLFSLEVRSLRIESMKGAYYRPCKGYGLSGLLPLTSPSRRPFLPPSLPPSLPLPPLDLPLPAE